MAPKLLGEILQEQQEPFTLEVYLLERGYMKKKISSNRSFGCCSTNSTMFLKRSASCGIDNRRRVVPNCSKIVKVVFNKLLSIDSKLTQKNYGRKQVASVQEMRMNSQEEEDKFSSASSTTVFNSCSNSDVEEVYDLSENERSPKTCHANLREEVATQREFQWEGIEDDKQLSPVSVLEEIKFNEARQNSRAMQEGTSTTCKKLDEKSIFSVSRVKLSVHSLPKEPNHTRAGKLEQLVLSNPYSSYTNNKRALQQSERLLFDCLREVVDTHRGKDKRSLQFQEILVPDELRKLLCENIRAWSRQSIDETNKTHPQNLDLSASAEAWRNFEQETREIGMEIGDAILEDINNEIVTDMIKFVRENIR